MSHEFILVDVFTDRPFAGNQLAVLPGATGLTAREMQAIAREFNFAETAFVLPPVEPRSTARLRIFSPRQEMPFAGHPTVGSAAALVHHRGAGYPGTTHIVFDEAVGPVTVLVTVDGDVCTAELKLTTRLRYAAPAPDRVTLARALSLDPATIRDVWCAGVGLPFVFCELASPHDVTAAAVARAAFDTAVAGAGADKIYIFAHHEQCRELVSARMFAPGAGIEEDPATGSAAAALIGRYATQSTPAGSQVALTIHQGDHIGRPSVLLAAAEQSDTGELEIGVGGRVVIVGSGTLHTADD